MDDVLVEQERQRRRRQARRDVARRHHPDVGGDLDTYLELMQRLDRDVAGDPPDDGDETGVPLSRRMRRLTSRTQRRLRRHSRAARGRLPKRFPGSRRYIDL
ncbi:MAG: hypothetical protein M3419_04060 [Actinomycetota bacterium]|nr:hypothetical protein [Actinomycetota bacterium]